MEPTAVCPPRTPAPVRSWRLPLALSVGAHGLLLLIVCMLPCAAGRQDHRSLPIDTCVLEPELRLVDTPPRRRAAPPHPTEPIHFPIIVDDLPAAPAPPGPEPGHGPDARSLASDDPPVPTGGAGDSAGGSGGSAGTGPAIFQVAGRGQSVVYVIDRSLSMGLNGALAAARDELLASLERLPESVRFQVILYNHQAEPMRLAGRTGLAPATAASKEQAAALLQSLRAEGPTDHLAALKRALLLRPEVIFFITDAADLTEQQVRAITQQNRGHSALHAIELARFAGDSRGDGPLALLARSNGGTYRSVGVSSRR